MTVLLLQLTSKETAEAWASAMQRTRAEFEQKLRRERDAAVAFPPRQQEILAQEEILFQEEISAEEEISAGEEISAVEEILAVEEISAEEEISTQESRSVRKEAASSARGEADTAAEIFLCRDREQTALQEADRITSEIDEVMARVQASRARLWKLEEEEYDSVLQEERLTLELEQVQQKSQAYLGMKPSLDVSSSDAAASSTSTSDAAQSSLPHELVVRVNAVLDKVSGDVQMILSFFIVSPLLKCKLLRRRIQLTLRSVAAVGRG